MNAYTHGQRLNYLGLKAKTLGLTDEERKELERLQSIRVTEVSGGTVLIEAPPMSVEDWKAMLQRRRESRGPLLAPPEEGKSE